MAAAPPIPRHRDQRLEIRVTSEQKDIIERAAKLQGRTVSDFVVSSLQDAGRRAIDEYTSWTLSQEQQQVFIDALLNPPAPNEQLKSALRRYRDFKASRNR